MLSLNWHWRLRAGQLAAVELEVGQPVGALAVAVDRIGQAALFPQPADQHLAAQLLDHLGNLARHAGRIAGVAIRVENEHAFVNVDSHDDHSS